MTITFCIIAYLLFGALAGVLASLIETNKIAWKVIVIVTFCWLPMVCLGLSLVVTDEIQIWRRKRIR